MINQVDNVNWLKSLKADISSVSLRKSDWRNYGLFVGSICRKWSYVIGGNMVTRKQE